MNSLYLHIPYCKQACHYCDFHFSTNLNSRREMIQAIRQEMELQKEYLSGSDLETVYLGGGTPSILEAAELGALFEAIHQHFSLLPEAEITLEANPDDLNPHKIRDLKSLGINRLSIGIQSLHNEQLNYLNRAHSEKQARDCIEDARKGGIEDISIDLIYAIPAPDHRLWEKNLAQIIDWKIPHISAYCLTIEEKTVFGNWLKKNKIQEVEDDFAEQQFHILIHSLKDAGYEHYELSNFAQPGHYARHNSNYWCRGSYLGLGPGAHSFDQNSRQNNIAHNQIYLRSIREGKIPAQKEILSNQDRANEYLMTSLRTQWGCDLNLLEKEYGYKIFREKKQVLEQYMFSQLVRKERDQLILTDQGKFVADQIIQELFIAD